MNPVFLCDGVRTPIGRYGGSLASVRTDELAAHPIAMLMARNDGFDWDRVEDVVMGCANQAGEDNRNVARMATLLAGLDNSVPAVTLNRLCGSGMDAVAMIARGIAAGEIDIGIAGGVEGMTRAPYVMGKAETAFGRSHKLEDTTMGWRFINKRMKDLYGTDTMPETAENLADQYDISRDDQDAFAQRSQSRAMAAHDVGRFDREIAPVTIPVRKGDPILFSHDEHPRASSLEGLAKLKPIVRADGTVTAGNASGINDGSAALLLASAEAVEQHGLKPIPRIAGCAVAGTLPRIMGIGPVPATKKLLKRLKLSIGDMDVVELNEAFAAQALAVLRCLGLPDDGDFINPNGGAIALGHPLGMSGARLVLTAAHQLQETNTRYALTTMCIGVGQGISMILEKV